MQFRSRSTKCEYLDGSCLASPRWVSLLVAEIYYPEATFPNPATAPQNRNPVQGATPPAVSFMVPFTFKFGDYPWQSVISRFFTVAAQ